MRLNFCEVSRYHNLFGTIKDRTTPNATHAGSDFFVDYICLECRLHCPVSYGVVITNYLSESTKETCLTVINSVTQSSS